MTGPVSPTPQAIGALTPLSAGDVRLTPGGILGDWQARNAAATLPHCIDNVESSGALPNLRLAAGGNGGEYTGMWFTDSDVYKTLEAAAWESARPGAAAGVGDFIELTSALLAKAQADDGYLNSYFTVAEPDQKWRKLRWSHELYCAGHLIQAAVAASRGGIGGELVRVARRFADLLVERFLADGVEAVCGHPEIETALVELYRLTGHLPYLQLAAKFVNLRGRGLLGDDKLGRPYFQDHAPVREAEEVTGHAVRQLYLLAGVVDVAVETGDAELLRAAERLWDSAFRTKTYLTGAHGSRHRDEAFGDPYELPSDRAYAETCAAIASFQWNWRMLLATGNRRYADEMERVLYNAVAVSTALDGTHFFYSNPLQLRPGHDGSNEDAPSTRLAWYSCACCPPNLARLMASLQSYVATTDAAGLQIQLYGAGSIRAYLGDAEIGVTMRTAYPMQGRVALTVDVSTDAEWTLSLRVPAWCTGLTVSVDGDAVPNRPHDGYLRLTRTWTVGAKVVLDLDMPPRMVTAHPNVDAVRGCVALTRGPLVYCLEQVDSPVPLDDLRLAANTSVDVVDHAASPIPVTLNIHAAAVDPSVPTPEADRLYRDITDTADEKHHPVTVTAVPYFLWGNRTPGPMRVWVPLGTPQH